MLQRKGRIERRGNQNAKIFVYRYATSGTFDSYLWQTLENKQKFISQIMTSKSPVRSCEDVDETALSFAEIKALCAGDPRIKERMDLDLEVSKLRIMKADHNSKQYRLEDDLLKNFPEQIQEAQGFIAGLQSDIQTLQQHPHPADGFAGMEIHGTTCTDKTEAGAALIDACREISDTDPATIGTYRGFALSAKFSGFLAPTISVKGAVSYQVDLGADARGNLTRIDNALARLPENLERWQTDLSNLLQQQEAAKRDASIITCNALFREVKENAMFVGPTGCGKTHIWRCLQELFPDRIEIVDGSNITADGWKGDKKWSSLLQSPIFDTGKRAILVIDEADKMLAPKYSSGGENVSQSIASEGLKLMEGTVVETKSGSVSYQVDTSLISFVLCGAFSNKADEIARNSSIGSSIGFGALSCVAKAYDRPLMLQDLIEFGVMPEFLGRIHRIVNLQPMTLDDYYRIIDSGCGPVRHVQEQYGVEIRMTKNRRRELAEDAYRSGLGIRGMENRIRQLVDDAIFENCNRQSLEL